MNRKHVYLLFCVLGVVLPYWQFLPWVLENGLHMKLFVQQLFANRIGGFFGMDVLVSAVVLIFFIRREGLRLGVRYLWLPIAGVLTVGVSLGLPLFLYFRESAMQTGEILRGQRQVPALETTSSETFRTIAVSHHSTLRASESSALRASREPRWSGTSLRGQCLWECKPGCIGCEPLL